MLSGGTQTQLPAWRLENSLELQPAVKSFAAAAEWEKALKLEPAEPEKIREKLGRAAKK